MSKNTAALLMIGLSIAGTAAAEMRATEHAIESSTASLHLPDRLPSSIALAPCDNGCAPTLLQLTETSRFFHGRTAVTFGELRELSSRPALNVAVYFEPGSKVVTRIVISDGTK